MTSEQGRALKQTAITIQSRPGLVFHLLLVLSIIFELLYIFLIALSPLPGPHLSDSPLVKAWPWTLTPAHWLMTAIHPFIQAYPWLPSLLLALAFSGLAGTYGAAILISLRTTHKQARYWLLLLLGTTLIFGVTLLFQPLLFSDDVFTYIFSGRILAIYHADPLNTAPIQFPRDPYLQWVLSGRHTPNIFGPLWLWVSSQLATVSASPLVTLLLFKGLALLAHMLNCILIWAILSKIAPERRVLCVLLYAWNPLVLIELAGSGHNEGFLMSLLLLATLLYVLKFDQLQPWKWICETGSLLIFGLAISTNLVTLLLVPLLLWFEVRETKQPFWDLGWRALIMLIPALLVSLQFWHGAYTFFAITSAMNMEHFVHAPVGLLAVPLHQIYQDVADQWHIPSIIAPTIAADVTLRASATFIFILIYGYLFSQVRQAPTRTSEQWHTPYAGFDVLLKGWGVTIFWYMILVSGWFWPWYLLWMFWIIALQRLDAFNSAMLILSCTALFIYSLVGFSSTPIATYLSALIFGVPLVYLIVAWGKQKQAERVTISHD